MIMFCQLRFQLSVKCLCKNLCNCYLISKGFKMCSDNTQIQFVQVDAKFLYSTLALLNIKRTPKKTKK